MESLRDSGQVFSTNNYSVQDDLDRLILGNFFVSPVCPTLHRYHNRLVRLCPGWPRHKENRENREFGSYFFQTGKTQGILL